MPTDSTLESHRECLQSFASVGRLKRVLFLLGLDPAGKFGSIEEQTLTLARAFRDEGGLFLPIFVRVDSESKSMYASEGLAVESLDLLRFEFANLKRLLTIIRRNHIEVLHWNFLEPLANRYIWALSVLTPRVEHYFTDHMSRYMDRRGISRGRDLKSILKRPAAIRLSKILCVSDYVRDQASGVFGSRAERIHHFVNTSRFRPDPAVRWHVRHELGDETKFVVLIVAQLIKDKGLDVALRAAEKLPADVVLWVVGGGPEQDQLKAMAQRLGLAARARFLGPRRNVEPLMQAADCAVCPSVWAEAAGLVNIEAPACGLPAVASRIGGIPEFVEDGRNGFLFTAGDHNELAERIRRLRDDPPLRQRLSQDARTIAVERHSTENLLPQHMAIYRTAAARRDRLNGQGESSRGL